MDTKQEGNKTELEIQKEYENAFYQFLAGIVSKYGKQVMQGADSRKEEE